MDLYRINGPGPTASQCHIAGRWKSARHRGVLRDRRVLTQTRPIRHMQRNCGIRRQAHGQLWPVKPSFGVIIPWHYCCPMVGYCRPAVRLWRPRQKSIRHRTCLGDRVRLFRQHRIPSTTVTHFLSPLRMPIISPT